MIFLKRLLVIAGPLAMAGLALILYTGGKLTESTHIPAGQPPAALDATEIMITGPADSQLKCWLIKGQTSGVILLLHSVRSNRVEMLSRAGFLKKAGYSVLMFDLQAHGENPGDRITFGYRESIDVHRAIAYLRRQYPSQPIGIIGASLGGAASLLGESPVKADAVVLEGVYSHIDQAIENRLRIRFGFLAKILTPLLSWQIEPLLGISREQLSPLSAIRMLKSPVFIMAGSKDKHTTPTETKAIYNAAPGPKQLWLVPGAVHQNLHKYSGKEYERRVLDFFREYLQ